MTFATCWLSSSASMRFKKWPRRVLRGIIQAILHTTYVILTIDAIAVFSILVLLNTNSNQTRAKLCRCRFLQGRNCRTTRLSCYPIRLYRLTVIPVRAYSDPSIRQKANGGVWGGKKRRISFRGSTGNLQVSPVG